MSVQNSFLLKYTKKSTRISKHECSVCNKQFSLPSILAAHMKNQHGKNIENLTGTKITSPQKTKTRGRPRRSGHVDSEAANQRNDETEEQNGDKKTITALQEKYGEQKIDENGAGDGSLQTRKTKVINKKAKMLNINSTKQNQTPAKKASKKDLFDQRTSTPINCIVKVENETMESSSNRKRQLTGDDTGSDSQSEIGTRRPKRNRREKRAWSPSNDNSIVLEPVIKQEPIDFVEEVEQLVMKVLNKDFTCETCDKSFSTKAGLSRHLRFHQDKEEPKSVDMPDSSEDLAPVEELQEEDIKNGDKDEHTDNDGSKLKTPKRRGRARGKTYPCDSCIKVFNKPSHLLRHKVKHTGERPWPCDVCGKGFVSKSNMEKHRVLHTGLKKEICDECGKAFALHSYLVRHKMLHQKERNHQMGIKEEPEHHLCSECGKVFSKANYLARHMERHIKGKCYECRICGKKFSQRMNRINHEFLHTKTKDYECHICKKKFALKCYLKIHLERHVKSANNPERKRKPKKTGENTDSSVKAFKCNQCGKGYSSLKYLQAHERFHSDPKKFVCEVCGRKFHQKINLQRHMLTHTDPATSRNHECKECGKKYSRDIYLDRHIKENHTPEGLAKPRHQCQFCEKSFMKPCLLRIHERTHTKEKPFVCSTCGKGFAQEGYMKIHEEIHSQYKKHECTFCGKSFALLYYLTRHLARHEQTKTIGCDQCSKMFASQKALFDHQRMHTGDLPFKCDLCNKSFPRSNSLQRHKKLNACQNKLITPILYRPAATSTSTEHFIQKQEVSCLYICSICRQVFTSQTKLNAHVAEHERVTTDVEQEEEIPDESIPVTKEEETIIAEVVNVEESLLGGEEITTEETVVDADWLNRLFENAHVESGTDGKIIIVVNRE